MEWSNEDSTISDRSDFLEHSEILYLNTPSSVYMSHESGKEPCCPMPGPAGRCCVEAIVSVDERGQMVLPKELRTRAGIQPGDKLAAVSWEKNGKLFCIMLLPVEQLAEPVRSVVGPMMKEVL
jgi:AbrB family looped-hinge helix DNA binding protein